MAWRITALGKPPMTQYAMDFGLCIGALIIVLPTVWTVSQTTRAEHEVSARVSGSDAKEVEG